MGPLITQLISKMQENLPEAYSVPQEQVISTLREHITKPLMEILSPLEAVFWQVEFDNAPTPLRYQEEVLKKINEDQVYAPAQLITNALKRFYVGDSELTETIHDLIFINWDLLYQEIMVKL